MEEKNAGETQLILSYLTLRKAIGWLGILLPVVLFIGNYLISAFTDFENGCNPFKSSISHYYYTRLSELFTGTMCAVALFLYSYNGHQKKEGEKGLSDRLLSNLAASFALLVVLFPTSTNLPLPCNIRSFVSSDLTGNIHLIMAVLFFVTLAYMSYFNFTKTSGEVTPQKIRRNKIYRRCAIVMVSSLVLIAVYLFALEGKSSFLDKIHPVFCFEATALFAFGFSWLTKGEFLLKD